MVEDGNENLEKVDILVNVVDALMKLVSIKKFRCCYVFMGLGALSN
jgi:hypothetical protein